MCSYCAAVAKPMPLSISVSSVLIVRFVAVVYPPSSFTAPRRDSSRCLVAQLALGKPIFGGRTRKQQLEYVFKCCGSPGQGRWPEGNKAPLYRHLRPVDKEGKSLHFKPRLDKVRPADHGSTCARERHEGLVMLCVTLFISAKCIALSLQGVCPRCAGGCTSQGGYVIKAFCSSNLRKQTYQVVYTTGDAYQ